MTPISIIFNNNSIFNNNYDTKNQIENNLTYFILTNPGESIGKPSYGFGLLGYLFEQIPEQEIKDNLESKLNDQFSDVEFNSINVQRYNSYLYISVSYKYKTKEATTLNLQISDLNKLTQ